MSRVNESRQAQRQEAERRAQEKQQSTTRQQSDQFAKLVKNKQGDKKDAGKQPVVKQPTKGDKKGDNVKTRGSSQAQAAAGAKANAALMARAGISGNSFAAQLHKQGEANRGVSEGQAKVTGDRAKGQSTDTEERMHTESEVRQDKTQQKQGDKLAAISRDDRGEGGQGGEGFGQSGRDNTQSTGLEGGQVTEAKAETLQQAKGAAAPRIPQAVLEEIVQRVLVGVNEEGLNEFHIQFKEDVLGGASLQLSAEGGKIHAKFTTSDKNTSRLLKASEGQLARAFSYKGLSLESMEVGER